MTKNGFATDRSLDVSEEVEQHKWNSKRQNGDAIRKQREEAGFTRLKVAQRMGVEVRTLARWELEGVDPDHFEKVVWAFQTIRAMRQNMEGVSPAGTVLDLSKISTVDLSEELVRRSRMMEERDRKLLLHRDDLESKGLGSHFPKDL